MKVIFCLVILLFSIVMSGCSSLGYYFQSITGQMEVLHKREAIDDIIARSDTDDNVRQKLISAIEILEFAHNVLTLPDNGSYRHYTDLNRPFVVWNVIATPEFSLQPKEWCYLFLGCLSYRGFFNEKAAIAYAKTLQQDSYDVYIGGVSAYSTLGWFKDPVINNILNREDWEIARLIFHELAHQIVYVDDDTNFNEAFADTVSRIGLEKWLQSKPPETRQHVQQIIAREDEFIHTILAHNKILTALYDSDHPEAIIKARKIQIIASLRDTLQRKTQQWDSKARYQSWLTDDINNARLAIVSTYRSLVPRFLRLFDESHSDLGNFYKKVVELAGCTDNLRIQVPDMPDTMSDSCIQ